MKNAQENINSSMCCIRDALDSLNTAMCKCEKQENKDKIKSAIDSINCACEELKSYKD